LQYELYTRDFKEWDRKPKADQLWTTLKTFIQEAYTHRLNTTNITAGQHSYVQNAHAALAKESTDGEDDDVQIVIMQMAALTMQSQMMVAIYVATTLLVTTTINQLATNQQAMLQQITAFANAARAPPAAVQFPTQFTTPTVGNFQGGGCRGSRHGG
jgi:hypothetical protein